MTWFARLPWRFQWRLLCSRHVARVVLRIGDLAIQAPPAFGKPWLDQDGLHVSYISNVKAVKPFITRQCCHRLTEIQRNLLRKAVCGSRSHKAPFIHKLGCLQRHWPTRHPYLAQDWCFCLSSFGFKILEASFNGCVTSLYVHKYLCTCVASASLCGTCELVWHLRAWYMLICIDL
jgi:hypothetical protein